ncbi:MAG: phosphomannomutase/phosphoglucomutase [Patescibacteria group bacterium]
MQPSIFKSYDIRGRVPEELDMPAARRIGKALAQIYKPKHVLVGRDMRTTSPELEQALIEGLVGAGANVTMIGLCSTPMFNFAVGSAGDTIDLGVMVTASHNPAIYNGFKLVQTNAVPIGQGSGMEELRALATSDEPLLDGTARGTIDADDTVLDRYMRRVTELAQMPQEMPNFHVAIDAGNGMNGLTLPVISRRLGDSRIISLYWELDGSFPHHEANPLKGETLADLRSAVKREHCHFGVAFDGDGDRVGFMDELGVAIPGDIMTALFARELLREHPGEKILFDLRASWSVPEIIAEQGGVPEMCRVGHAHIKRQMRETNAMFAGEMSMHFYFRDLWNCEASDLAMLLLAKIVARENKPLSQIWRPLVRYSHSGEINFHVEDAPQLMKTIEEAYATKQPTAVSHLDGVKMEWKQGASDDWWFNLRASNTEPLLRLNLEARTPEEMEKRKAELTRLIQS